LIDDEDSGVLGAPAQSETFAELREACNTVIPAPHQVRDKLQPESSNSKYFLDSGSLAQTVTKERSF